MNRGSKKLTHDYKKSDYVHGDNGESIKITVRWHFDPEDTPNDAATVNPAKDLPATITHVLLVRTYMDSTGFIPDVCYFTFIPKAEFIGKVIVTYLSQKDQFVYENIPTQTLNTFRHSALSSDTVDELNKEFALINGMDLSSTEKDLMFKARVGHGKFKRDLFRLDSKCRICGISDPRLLIASHIKPWSKCDTGSERIDPYNGFLFCPNHDTLFDRGLISFKDTGEILIAHSLDSDTRLFMNVQNNMRITVSDQQLDYIQWHREEYKNKLLLEGMIK